MSDAQGTLAKVINTLTGAEQYEAGERTYESLDPRVRDRAKRKPAYAARSRAEARKTTGPTMIGTEDTLG